MSGGSDSTNTTVNPPDWAVPYFQNYAQQAAQVASRPYTPYTGQTTSQLNPYQTMAADAQAQRAIQGSPVNAAAQGQLTDTLNGSYLSQGNPYLTGMIDQAQGDVVRNYNNVVKPQTESAMVRSGSFGNSGLQQMQGEQQRTLQQSLGNISTQMRGSAYESERARQMQGLSLAPSIANQDYVDAEKLAQAGNVYQAQEQNNLNDQYRRFQEAQNYPERQLEILGRGLGQNYGSNSQGPSQGGNPWGSAAGGALAGYQMTGSPWGAAAGAAAGYAGGK